MTKRVARSDAADVVAEVEDLRSQIDAITAEVSRVKRLNVSKEEAIARLDKALEARCEVPTLNIRGLIRPDGMGDLNLSAKLVDGEVSDRFIDLILAANKEKIRAFFIEEIEREYASSESLSTADQQKRLAELDEKLLSLSLREEALIRASEQRGFEIMRRGSDPRALLAADSALPQL